MATPVPKKYESARLWRILSQTGDCSQAQHDLHSASSGPILCLNRFLSFSQQPMWFWLVHVPLASSMRRCAGCHGSPFQNPGRSCHSPAPPETMKCLFRGHWLTNAVLSFGRTLATDKHRTSLPTAARQCAFAPAKQHRTDLGIFPVRLSGSLNSNTAVLALRSLSAPSRLQPIHQAIRCHDQGGRAPNRGLRLRCPGHEGHTVAPVPARYWLQPAVSSWAFSVPWLSRISRAGR